MTGDADLHGNPKWPSGIRPWPAGFPEVSVQTALGTLYAASLQSDEQLDKEGKSPSYLEAKKGDISAAVRVVRAVIRPEGVVEYGRRFPGSIVASIHAEEAVGRNKLASVYAAAVGDLAILEVEDSIVQTNRVHHTGANARQRLARRPVFDGTVAPGRDYIIVDDVVTSGSSLAALRHFIEGRGGRVVFATTLAAAAERYGMVPTRLAVSAQTLAALQTRFVSDQLDGILSGYGIAPSFHHLTESEGRTILGFDSLDAFRSSLVAARQTGYGE